MLDLYMAECRRFARWGVAIAALHLTGLLILQWLFPILREDEEICTVAGFVYAGASAAFGFYQAAAYARINHWIALLHRPLAPWRIAVGVVGAGATIAFLVATLPLLLYTASLLVQVGRVVDARHWGLVVAAGLIGLIGFLTGNYLALAPRRYGWTAVVAVFVMIIGSKAVGSAALLFQAGTALVIGLSVIGAFKPDRTLAPANPGLLAVTSGMAALALFFLLLGGSGFGYQLGLTALGRNPLVNASPPGGPIEASRANSGELIASALETAPGREAAAIRAALRSAEGRRLPIALNWLPTRGDLKNAGSLSFLDPRRSVEWTYSYDANAFRGVRLKDRSVAGELRAAGGFAAPALLVGDGMMIAGPDLFRFEARRGVIERQLHLAQGELIAAKPVPLGTAVALLGSRALHLLDGTAITSVPLPGQIGDLRRLDAARLSDRTVISFLFGRDSIEGPDASWQQVVSIRPDGTIRQLARLSLGPDLPAGLRFRSDWLSPAIRAAVSAAEMFGAPNAPVFRRAAVQVPRGIWLTGALLSLAAAAGALILARRRRLEARETVAWTLAVFALGLPMFAAFCLVGAKSK